MELISYFGPDEYETSKEDSPWVDREVEFYNVSSTCGLYIARPFGPAYGHINNDGKLVSALFDTFMCSHQLTPFSFCIAVLPEYRKRGLGEALVDLALERWQERNLYLGYSPIEVDVISPHMVKILERKGFAPSSDRPGVYVVGELFYN